MITKTQPSIATRKKSPPTTLLFILFFVSGFTALLYQVAWQRMLGLFSGSDVRSVTVVIASYLLGLGLGNLISSRLADSLSSRACVRAYGLCNLGIAIFAVASRYLFYDLLFLRGQSLAQSPYVMLSIVLISLLLPTTLMGLSLPLLSKAVSRSAEGAAAAIGWLYGVNTLGSGLGTLVSGWLIVGSLGYARTVLLGAALSFSVSMSGLLLSRAFSNSQTVTQAESLKPAKSVNEWYFWVFVSGFAAISWEIIWFRILDIGLQSNAYTYAHLLAFVLSGNGIGSLVGSRAIQRIRNPQRVFCIIQSAVALYSAIAIWLVALVWQNYPQLRADEGFIDSSSLDIAFGFKYLIVPAVITVIPSLLLGFYFPLVQKAVQQDGKSIGKRVGSILVANILGNVLGSLLTGLVLLRLLGTAGSIKLLCLMGLGFLFFVTKKKLVWLMVIALAALLVAFPNNSQLWAAMQGINSKDYFIVAEDSTSVAAITQRDSKGKLYASGQIQANFPYLHIHGLLGGIPALLHPNPTDITIIGLGSGGTPHSIGVNPATEKITVVELLGAELTVLEEYAQTHIGKPLQHLFTDSRYQIVVGDGRREITQSDTKYDIIEADAIQPWRSRAGMLYSQEFFREVQSKLKPGGFFVEWNVGYGTMDTMLSVFPHVTSVGLGQNKDLWILIGSQQPVEFHRDLLLSKLESPKVQQFLSQQVGIDVELFRQDVINAVVQTFSQAKDGIPTKVNTDLFPRGEYYLNAKF